MFSTVSLQKDVKNKSAYRGKSTTKLYLALKPDLASAGMQLNEGKDTVFIPAALLD
jgi:hypothetical protein